MNYANICFLICRVIVLILQLYGLILSSFYVLPSCHFISAISINDETHGVGLKSFETNKQECIPHNAFIKEHYNGMEMVAKVCGYVAPGLACLTLVWLLGECCKKGGCWSGKCIPGLLMLATLICQGLTFLLFNSELFCKNEDIQSCALGDAAYSSVQACVIYAVAFIMYYFAPNPKPLTGMVGSSSSRTVATANSSKSGGEGKKKKKKSKPDAGEEYTREMYAQRRKEKNIKTRGVSGRSKREIFEDLNSGDKEVEEPYDESQIVLYDPETGQRREDDRKRNGGSGRRSPQPRFDDYVDEPDGMDWSAYSPNERDEYQERKRSKKKQREREKKEAERRERREAEQQYYEEDRRRRYDDRYPQDDETYRSEYTEDDYYRRRSRDETEYTEDLYDDRRYDDRSYDDRYEDSYRSNDYGYGRHEDSYRSRQSSRSGDRRGSYDYDDGYSYQSGQDEFSAYDSRAGDGYYDEPQDDDRYYGRGGSGRGDESSYGYDSRADDSYYESPRSRSDRGGYYS